MIRIPNLFKRANNQERINSEYVNELIDEIHEVSRQIAQTELWFQMESDNDLIDACIHQREVLQARYRYLVSKAKDSNVNIDITPENIFSI